MIPRALRLGMALLLGVALPAAPASAQLVRGFAPRFAANDRGDILLIGNTLMTCGGGSSCVAGQGGGGGRVNNDDYLMQFVDVDGVGSTFSSSAATLSLPPGATVLWAGLYWGGSSSDVARDRMVFTTPAAAGIPVTAARLDASGADYQGFADVTALVTAGGNGTYMAADVRSTAARDSYAGWALVVAYRLASLPIRNLVAFDGYARLTPSVSVTIPVSGFLTPRNGTVNTRLGVVAYEGDLGLPGDQFLLDGQPLGDAANPSNNFFNSGISQLGAPFTARNPNHLNQLGFDIDLIGLTNALPNNASSATIGLMTSADRFFPGVVTFTTELYAPDLSGDGFRKTVVDLNGGPANPGDVLEYTIAMTNRGDDDAIQTVLADTLPADVSYLPGSIVVLSGANAGAKSDAGGDDQAEYEAGSRRVVARMGGGADALSGGVLASGESTRLRFRVAIGPSVPGGAVVSNQAGAGFSGGQTGIPYTSRSDGDSTLAGDQPTVITVTAPVVPGVTVAGVVYADADHDFLRDAAEAGTGLGLYAKLVSPAAPLAAQAVVAVDPGTGAYAFTFVPAGTYSIVVDDNAVAADLTPTAPAGWIVTEAAPGIRAGVVVAAAGVSDQDVGLYRGSRIEGVVFRDDGAGASVANDGVRQAGEAGLPAVRVRALSPACAGGACDSALTDGAGAWTLWLGAAAAGPVEVAETNAAGWISTGASVGTSGGAYARPSDAIAFSAAAGSVTTGLAFGDVPPNRLVPSGVRSGAPGGVVFHPHTFTAGSAGTVQFTLTRSAAPPIPGWSADLFRDLDCDGAIDPGEPAVTAPIAAATGQMLCLVLRHTLPAAAPGGATESVTLDAGFDYINAAPALASFVQVGDLTTTVVGGGLEIVKRVDVVTARPGDYIRYTITYHNPGAEPLTSIVIQDATPAFTVFDSATCDGLGAGLAGCTVTAAPASGASGGVAWTLAGALAPGGSGTVSFRVRVQ